MLKKQKVIKAKSNKSVFQRVFPTFNIFAPHSYNRHIANANIHNSAQDAIRDDWLNVISDVEMAAKDRNDYLGNLKK